MTNGIVLDVEVEIADTAADVASSPALKLFVRPLDRDTRHYATPVRLR